MNPVLVATALTVVAGAIVAVSARDARLALAGLAIALVASPLLVDPLPAALPLLARILAALLAVELLWIAARLTPGTTRGSLVGWPVETLAALAAGVVGVIVASAAAPSSAPADSAAVPLPAILGSAFALGALAVVPVVTGRDALRLATGAALLVTAALALEAGAVGAPTAFEQLVAAGAVVAVGAAGAALIANAFAARGDLSLAGPARPPAPPSPAAVRRPAMDTADPAPVPSPVSSPVSSQHPSDARRRAPR